MTNTRLDPLASTHHHADARPLLPGPASATEARVLVVDDQASNVLLLSRILQREGFVHIKTTTDARQAIPLFASFDPDVLLLDLHMPHLDGFEVMRQIGQILGQDAYVPTFVLTADRSTRTRDLALSMGAHDFLVKPLDPTEVVLRLRNLLATRRLHQRLTSSTGRLQEQIAHEHLAAETARIEILDRLARAVDLRDNETFAHTERVGDLAARLAVRLGIPPPEVELLRRAAPLHDIGKIGIRDAVLRKPGPLTDEEFAHIRTHTTIGADLLAGSVIPVLQIAQVIAVGHHERYDGTGYPNGLRGAAIPIEARIVAVADVFDALTHARPYKPAWSLDRATAEIASQRATQFDPDVVDAFFGLT